MGIRCAAQLSLVVVVLVPGAQTAMAKSASPCPDKQALSQKIGAAWKAQAKDVHVEQCVPGAFPVPGWAVVAWIERDGGVALRHVVLDEQTGAIIAQLDGQDTGSAKMDYNEFQRLVAVDLDRDGTDEIVEYSSYDKGGRKDRKV